MSDVSNKINVLELLTSVDLSNPKSIEDLQSKLNNDPELKKELSLEIARHFLSCIALSEALDLKLDEFMQSSSPEELADFFGMDQDDEDCDDSYQEEEDGCCGSC